MSGKGVRSLNEAFRTLSLSSPPTTRHLRIQQAKRQRLSSTHRSMATTTRPPNLILPSGAPLSSAASQPSLTATTSPKPSIQYTHYTPRATTPLTIFDFPTLSPLRLEHWSPKPLHLPLRRDILHAAIIHSADAARQGTASSKTKWDVRGSHKKIYRQKGTGRARMGMKQNPSRKGSGKVWGPHPRSFATGLNRKVVDLAWRMALSYQYRRGKLIVCEDGMELPLPDEFLSLAAADRLGRDLEDGFVARYIRELLGNLEWGREHGRTLFITGDRRPNLFTGMEVAGEQGRALTVEDVEVKDLLAQSRVVVERQALKEMVEMHQSDLVTNVYVHGVRQVGPPVGDLSLGA